MTCDLENIFYDISQYIPISTDGNHKFIFSIDTLPQLPSRTLNTNRLCIKSLYHGYNNNYRVDQLWFFATKETYRNLGLLILAVIFHPEILRVEVNLTHPFTFIKTLVIENVDIKLDNLPSGYHTRPHCLVYYPELEGWHPWESYKMEPIYFPSFYLTDTKECPITEEDWQSRNKLIGFGNDHGSALLAELLLNIGIPHNELSEYHLESEAGYRGVGVMSAEASFFLPGNLAWNDNEWE